MYIDGLDSLEHNDIVCCFGQYFQRLLIRFVSIVNWIKGMVLLGQIEIVRCLTHVEKRVHHQQIRNRLAETEQLKGEFQRYLSSETPSKEVIRPTRLKLEYIAHIVFSNVLEGLHGIVEVHVIEQDQTAIREQFRDIIQV